MKNKSIDFDSIFAVQSRKAVDSWRGVVDVDDFDDEQPSLKEIYSGEFNSPTALEGTSGVYGSFQLVGHGLKTNDKCGTWCSFSGCSRIELHDKIIFDKNGVLMNCAKKGFFRPVYHSCDKPTCPVCYERGWAIRQAKSIEFRLEQASKRFGLVEHIIASVPTRDYGLSHEALRHKTDERLKARGVIGGVKIFHGFRHNHETKVWYWSPHFHCLGFIYGGYSRCRNCKNRKCIGYGNFDKCNGFEATTRKLNVKDGWIVKVKEKRKTVFGTAWYQLHHSAVDMSKKRYHVATWFGCVSYRKMKIDKEVRKEWEAKHKPKCPICGLPLTRHDYCGHKIDVIQLTSKCRGARESVKGFFDTASDWVEMAESGSGDYG